MRNFLLSDDMMDTRETHSYYYKGFLLGSLPYKRTSEHSVVRTYNHLTYAISKGAGKHNYELPYGNMARLLLHYICNEAIYSQDGVVVFGNSLSAFLRRLDLGTGGSTMQRAKEQLTNIFGATFFIEQEDNGPDLGFALTNKAKFSLVKRISMEWRVEGIDELQNFHYPEKNAILLDTDFYQNVKKEGTVFPVRLETLKKLKTSAFALDVYSWWTFKAYASMSWNADQTIPWKSLMAQFGSKNQKKPQFKQWFMDTVNEIKNVLPNEKKIENLKAEDDYLIFGRTEPDIEHKKRMLFPTKQNFTIQ